MSRTFCTTDTHGCAKELSTILEQVSFNFEEDTLIHLGDCVDRGPDSKGVIDILLSIKNLTAIRGNHDDWFKQFIETGVHGGQWRHGGEKTRESYASHNLMELSIPQSHRQFFKNQVNYHVDEENRLFVHAGYDREIKIEDQDDYMLFWNRDLINQARSAKNVRLRDVNNFKRVFVGHNCTMFWGNSTRPKYAAQVVDLDTGIAYGGKLTLMDITDDENHIIYQI